MSRMTRVTLRKRASKYQACAAHYSHLAQYYGIGAFDLRADGNSVPYSMIAAQAYKVAWHYLDMLIQRGPDK